MYENISHTDNPGHLRQEKFPVFVYPFITWINQFPFPGWTRIPGFYYALRRCLARLYVLFPVIVLLYPNCILV